MSQVNVDAEINKVFAEFEAEIENIISEEKADKLKTLGEMAQYCRDDISAHAPVDPEHDKHHKNQIQYRDGWSKQKTVTGFKVLNKKRPALTHILEFGTIERTTSLGRNRGVMPAIPHIRPAFAATIAKFNNKFK